MKTKNQTNDLNLYKRALKVAALEAYKNEVVETEMIDWLIGTGKEYPTARDWMDERVEYWLEQSELEHFVARPVL